MSSAPAADAEAASVAVAPAPLPLHSAPRARRLSLACPPRHPLGGQAGARGKTLRAAAAIDFAEEGGRGGRPTVRRGCSSPERTFRPLDVRVESASRLMSSPPRRLCQRERAGRGTIEDAAVFLRAAADAAERRRHGRTGGPVPPPAGLANTLKAAAAALRWTLGPTARGRRLRMRAAMTTTAPLPPRRL